MKDDSATVSLRAEETFEFMIDAELGREDRFGRGTDGAGPNLEHDLAHDAELDLLRFVLEADVECRQTRWRESERGALDDPRRQREPVCQAAAS